MYYDVQKSAERIRDLRADSNLTQSEAAERMGFSLSGYRKMEQGQNGGSVDSLIMVADYYNISIDYANFTLKLLALCPYPPAV